MTKLILNALGNLQNEVTTLSTINNNNIAIENALENTLSRDGTVPNQMLASLDMNSQRIINLPEPVNDSEPLRLGDTNIATLTEMEALKDAAEAAQAAAELAQENAETAETNAETAETNAETAQAAAEVAQTAAELAETNAETAETNAETAQTAAEAAQAAAETAQTAAELAETHAETAETSAQLSETNAETSKNAAAASASSASTSASTATTQASNASSSASAASTSASNALTSETNAATSASSAAAALQSVAYKYLWSTSTAGDPGTGKIAINNATVASATAMQISETDANSNAIAAQIAAWGANANVNGRARVRIAKDATNFITLTITSAVTDAGAYDTFTVTGGVLTGTISNGSTVYVSAAISGLDGVGGDFSSNTSSSVDSEIVLFSSTGGKTGKRATTTGILKGTSGVLSAGTAGTDYVAPATATTFTATQGYGETALTYSSGGTTAWDCSTAQCATVAMASGNSTMGAPTNVTAGRFYSYRIVQDTSPRTMAWNAAYKFIGAAAPTISTGSGAIDHIIFYGRGSNVLEEVGRAQGVA